MVTARAAALRCLLAAFFVPAFLPIRAEAVPARGHTRRLLFRHETPSKARGATFYDDLRLELLGSLSRRRQLLSEEESANVHASALDGVTGIDVLETPPGELNAWLLQALQSHPSVQYAEKDQLLSAAATASPDDPDLPQQWALYRLGLFDAAPDVRSASVGQPSAWARSEGSRNVTVCVIDSGIDYTHPDLAGNVWTNAGEIPWNGLDDDGNGFIDDYYGYNFLNNTGDVMDDNFHGTHLAGIVGARTDNRLGVAGVSPLVRIMACKFLDKNGDGYTSDAIRCMAYALQMGAHVTLNSYGGIGANSQSLATAIDRTESAGQLFVSAAGNDYGADIDAVGVYPASYANANILAVVATDDKDDLAPYSNYGATMADIAAPGSAILSTVLNNDYGYHDGTSQAAGFVAGAAALLLAAYQTAGYPTSGMAAAVKANILDSASPRSQLANTSVTGGVLDIAAAMALVPSSGTANASTLYSRANAPAAVQTFYATSDQDMEAESPSEAEESVAGPIIRTASGSSSGEKSMGSPSAFSSLTVSAGNWTVGTSLAFIQHGPAAYHACSQAIDALPNDADFGLDITDGLMTAPGTGYLIDLPEEVAIGESRIWRVALQPNGTLNLLEPFSAPEASMSPQPSATSSPAAMDGSGQESVLIAAPFLQANSTGALGVARVTYSIRPDRLVISFSGVELESGQLSAQMELFMRPGRFPAGSIRVSYLGTAPDEGLAAAIGALPISPADMNAFQASRPTQCLRPPTIRLLPPQLPLARLNSPQAAGNVSFMIENFGDATLKAQFEVDARGENVLQPELWLNPAVQYKQSFESANITCQQYEPGLDPICQEFEDGSVVMRGASLEAPMLYSRRLQPPFRIIAEVERTEQCANHYMVLSTQPQPPKYYGEPGSLWMLLLCSKKYIYTLSEGPASNRSCLDFGRNVLDARIAERNVELLDDFCSSLTAAHQLGPGPFYLFMGALCDYGTCQGGARWGRLDILEGSSDNGFWHVGSPPAGSPAVSALQPAGSDQLLPGMSSPSGAKLRGMPATGPADGLSPAPAAVSNLSSTNVGQSSLPTVFTPPAWAAVRPSGVSIRPQNPAALVQIRISGYDFPGGLQNASLTVRGNDPDLRVIRIAFQALLS